VPVRPATFADISHIAELIRELAVYEELEHEIEWRSPDQLAAHLFGEGAAASVLMAETNEGEVAGFALFFPTFSTFLGRPGLWLEDLFVRPEHRGQGYGVALLHAVRARTSGRVEWAVLDWNEPSIRFYRALGAEPIEGWTRYRWMPGAEPAT
jgi:GNAT superfamily N-acetyltransferase